MTADPRIFGGGGVPVPRMPDRDTHLRGVHGLLGSEERGGSREKSLMGWGTTQKPGRRLNIDTTKKGNPFDKSLTGRDFKILPLRLTPLWAVIKKPPLLT